MKASDEPMTVAPSVNRRACASGSATGRRVPACSVTSSSHVKTARAAGAFAARRARRSERAARAASRSRQKRFIRSASVGIGEPLVLNGDRAPRVAFRAEVHVHPGAAVLPVEARRASRRGGAQPQGDAGQPTLALRLVEERLAQLVDADPDRLRRPDWRTRRRARTSRAAPGPARSPRSPSAPTSPGRPAPR